MSPRWKPPHRDVPPTPTSQRRLAQETRPTAPPAPEATRPGKCRWPDCTHDVDRAWLVHMCTRHAEHIRNTLNSYDERMTTLIAESEAEVIANINAGVRLGRYDSVPGWIYYIHNDGTIKIGYSTNVTNRMRQYPPTAELLAVEPGTKELERKRHHHFHVYLAHGREWFRDTPEIRTWIDTLRDEYGDPSHMAYTFREANTRKQVTVPRGYRGVKRTAA